MECVKLKYFFKNEQKKTKMVRDERGYCSKGVGKKNSGNLRRGGGDVQTGEKR